MTEREHLRMTADALGGTMLARQLQAMAVNSLLSKTVSAASGAVWCATRYGDDDWHIVHRDGRSRRGSLGEIVRFVEGQ